MNRIAVKTVYFWELKDLKREALYFDKICYDAASSISLSAFPFAIFEAAARANGGPVCDVEALQAEGFATMEYLVDRGVLAPSDAFEAFIKDMNGKVDETGRNFKFNIKADRLNKDRLADETSLADLTELILAEGRQIHEDQQAGNVQVPRETFDAMCRFAFGLRKHLVKGGSEENVPAELTSQLDIVNRDLRLIRERGARRVKICSMLKRYAGADDVYIPILPENTLTGDAKLLRHQSIATVALSRFPAPSDETPWEQILDFRDDERNKANLRALRVWLTRVAKGADTAGDLEEELDYLLDEFNRQMRLHKMKYHQGTLEVGIVTALEVLEHLVKLNWGTAARKLFQLKQREVDFKIAEAEIVGQEVAYIAKAAETFR